MEQTIFFSIRKIEVVAQEAFFYELEPVESGAFTYQAGQFLTFIFRHSMGELRRSYSLCTYPGVDAYPAVLVKRIPNGEISRHIQDYWKVGDVVESLPPSGRFVLEAANRPRDLFLLAAGSGISPLMGLIKQALHAEPETNVHLFYSNRNVEQTIFYQELKGIQEQYAHRLHIDLLLSESKYLERARLNRNLLEKLVDSRLQYAKEDATFFVCGPYVYMQMVEIVLITMGFAKESIRKETFIIPKAAEPQFELEDKSTKEVQLTFQGKTYDIVVPYPQTILSVALEQGISLPYSCRAGRCSACVAKCLEGKVAMSYNEVLTEKDEQRGYVLTCTGHPVSQEVVLEF